MAKKYEFVLNKGKSNKDRQIYDIVGNIFHIVYYPEGSTITVVKDGNIYYRPDITDGFIMFLEQRKKIGGV